MLPKSFYVKGVTEWDIEGFQADPDDYDFQKRRDELYREWTAVGLPAPHIGCVKELKDARAELAVLLQQIP